MKLQNVFQDKTSGVRDGEDLGVIEEQNLGATISQIVQGVMMRLILLEVFSPLKMVMFIIQLQQKILAILLLKKILMLLSRQERSCKTI